MKVTCPNCKATLGVVRATPGVAVKCPKCCREILVDSPASNSLPVKSPVQPPPLCPDLPNRTKTPTAGSAKDDDLFHEAPSALPLALRSRWILIAASSFLLVAAIIAVVFTLGKSRSDKTADKGKIETLIESADLWTEFRKSPAGAQKKYGDKRLKTGGLVLNISGNDDAYIVDLNGTLTVSLARVRCHMNRTEAEKISLSNLVAVEGVCTGREKIGDDVHVKDCKVIIVRDKNDKRPLAEIKELSELLVSTDPVEQIDAARQVMAMGKSGREYLPQLIAMLDSANPRVAEAVEATLQAIGSPSATHLAQLSLALAPGKSKRKIVVAYLGRSQEMAQSLIPQIVQTLTGPNPVPAAAVETALMQIGAPVAADQIPVLAVLKDESAAPTILRYLGHLRHEGRFAVPTLLEMLDSPDPMLQAKVAQSLEQIGLPDDSASAILAKQLAKMHPGRAYALRCYAEGYTVPPEAVRPLLSLFLDPQPQTRLLALKAIGRAGRVARKDAIPLILKLYADADRDVAALARTTLESMRPFQPEDIEPLEAVLKEGANSDAQFQAAKELALLLQGKTDRLNDRFFPLLKAESADVRLLAVQTLSQSPANRKTVKSFLGALLADRDVRIRRAVVGVVAADDRDEHAFQALILQLDKEDDKTLFAEIIQAIGDKVKADKQDLPVLQTLIRKGGNPGKRYAFRTLAKLPDQSEPYLTSLREGLQSDDLTLRVAALRVFQARKLAAADIPMILKAIPEDAPAASGDAAVEGEPPTAEAVEMAAVDVIATAGEAGAATLVQMFDRAKVSSGMRRVICGQLAKRPVPPDGMARRVFAWVDLTKNPPEEAAELVAKMIHTEKDPTATLKALLERAEFSSPPVLAAHPPLVREWVLKTFAKLDPKKLSPELRRRIGIEVRNTSKYDPAPSIQGQATIEAARWP